jgi:hypothetical protein
MGMGSLREERSGLTEAIEGDATGKVEACQVLYSAKSVRFAQPTSDVRGSVSLGKP